jgi:hypothetical protein
MAAARPRCVDPDLRRAAVAFVVLTAVFSNPVIRGLGVVVVDADRSDTSRAFVEHVASSPGLSIVERPGDLASAMPMVVHVIGLTSTPVTNAPLIRI